MDGPGDHDGQSPTGDNDAIGDAVESTEDSFTTMPLELLRWLDGLDQAIVRRLPQSVRHQRGVAARRSSQQPSADEPSRCGAQWPGGDAAGSVQFAQTARPVTDDDPGGAVDGSDLRPFATLRTGIRRPFIA